MVALIRLVFLMIIVVTKTQCQSMDSIPENARQRLKEILPGISARGFDITGGMSFNANVLLANNNAILLKNTGGLYYLFANYDFDPEDKSLEKFKSEFAKVKILMIRHSLEGIGAAHSYHEIPEWVENFNNLECLILDNVVFGNEAPIEGLRLKLLGVLDVEMTDIQKVVQSISKIRGLEFFMHNESFSTREIEELKKLVPGLITFKPASIP
jgi:hypothetical protein